MMLWRNLGIYLKYKIESIRLKIIDLLLDYFLLAKMDKDSSDIMKGGSYIADVADDYWRGKNRASRGDRGRGERGSHDNRGGYESRGRGKKGGYKDSHEQTSKQEMDYNFHASQNQEEYKR